MYNVTQEFLNIIKLPNRDFQSIVTIRDTIFDDNNIIEFSLEEDVNPEDSFMIGSVASNKLEVTLIDVPDSLVLENAIVTPSIGLLVGDNYEVVPLGVFTVDDPIKDKNTVKLTCFDNMIKLEKAYFSNLNYPASINSVAQEICSKAGVQLATTLPSTTINKIEGYTCREAISFIASFLGGFARFNRLGKLEIVSYADSNFSITGDNYFKLKTAEKSFTIGRLACKVGENIISVGASGNEIQFENPIMTQAQLNNIYNTLKALSYMPYNMDWQGNPALMAGDKITIVDVDNNTYNTFLMQQKLTYKGGLSATATAKGKTEQAQEFSSSGSLTNKVERVVTEQANIKLALIDKATIQDLEAVNGRIDNLYTTDLTAVNAKITNLEVNKADVTQLNAQSAKIDDLYSIKATVKDLEANTAKITNLESKTANIENIMANKVDVVDFNADKANIESLIATKANIEYVNAEKVRIDDLYANKANIVDLNATNAKITNIEGKTANIEHILAGNIGAENIKAGTITAGSGIIADGAIGDAQISNLSASKVSAGTIDTSLVTVAGANGRLKISGNRIQVFDEKNTQLYERIMLGVDENNNSSLVLRGADGNTVLLNQNGLTKSGFTEGYNKADDYSLPGKKLDIDSVVREVNEEGTETIKGTKVQVGDRTLDIELSTQNSKITDISTQIGEQKTTIQALDNSIKLKVDNQTFNQYKAITDGNMSTINTNLSKATSDISILQGEISSKVSQSDIDKSINEISIGGRNLLKNSGTVITNSNYNVANYQSYTPLKPNTKYTVIFKGSVNAGNKIGIWWNHGSLSAKIFDRSEDGSIYTDVITTPSSINQNGINFYNYPSSTAKTCTIEWACLYEGDIKPPTSWSPAPEDIEQNATDTAKLYADAQIQGVEGKIKTVDTKINTANSEINQLKDRISLTVTTEDFESTVTTINDEIVTTKERISNTESSINILKGEINSKVSDTVQDLNGKIEANTSLIRQTSKDVNFEINTVKGNIDDVNNNVSEIKSYMNFSEDGLKLGKSDSKLSVQISNSQMDFMDSGVSAAYINGQQMYIDSLIVLSSTVVGVHKIEKYNNDITFIRWVGDE